MKEMLEIAMILLMLTNLMLLASSRLGAYVNIIIFQGIIMSLLPLSASHVFSASACLIALVILLVKVFLFPILLKRALRSANVRTEIEPYVGYNESVILGLAALILSFWLCKTAPFPEKMLSHIGPPAAIFTIFTGLFIIVSRVKALTQVIGYIVFENGIYALGASLMLEQGFLIELGIILDVFVLVFLMGIMTFHISRAFDHIDTGGTSGKEDR